MNSKSEAFHRLAEKRVETVCDAIRIFGNLSGPSYLWTPDEVLTYKVKIDAALDEAMARFRETKHWRVAEPAEKAVQAVEDEIAAEPDPLTEEPGVESPYLAQEARERQRRYTISEIIRNAASDPEPLAATIALQREVIQDLKDQLARKEA